MNGFNKKENIFKEVNAMKRNWNWVFTTILTTATALPAAAADGPAQASAMWIYFGVAIACGFAIGVAALGTGLSMGNAINAALTGIARNPETAGKIQTNLILGLAFIESLCIYALLICFMMVFKIPAFEALLGKLAG